MFVETYLDINLARSPCEITLGTSGQALHHVSARAFALQPRQLQRLLRLVLDIALIIKSLLAALLTSQRLLRLTLPGLLVILVFTEDEAVDRRVFDGWI